MKQLICFYFYLILCTDAAITAWTTPAVTGSNGTGTLTVAEDHDKDTTIVVYAANTTADVTYSLVTSVTPFALSAGGNLTITDNLDFETSSSYTLEVKYVSYFYFRNTKNIYNVLIRVIFSMYRH